MPLTAALVAVGQLCNEGEQKATARGTRGVRRAGSSCCDESVCRGGTLQTDTTCFSFRSSPSSLFQTQKNPFTNKCLGPAGWRADPSFLWLQLTCSCGGGHLYTRRSPAKALPTCWLGKGSLCRLLWLLHVQLKNVKMTD